MAKKMDELYVEVRAKMTVDDETAARCLRILEMWLEDNPTGRIYGGIRQEDGKVTPFRLGRGEEE